MSYSQEDLVRSRHFTTENNFESIHTLGDFIGAYVHNWLSHFIWIARLKSWCVISPLFGGKEEGTP